MYRSKQGNLIRRWLILAGGFLAATPLSFSAEPANGWRGNGTGLWPEAKIPREWSRVPHGAMEGLRNSAALPAKASGGREPPDTSADTPTEVVQKGLLRNWLVLGPFPVKDSVADFDKDLIGGETKLQPVAGGKQSGKEWQPLMVPPDDIMVFGTAEMPWLNLAKALGYAKNQVAYAHTYVHSPRGGKARLVMDHGYGAKVWVNGTEVYRQPERRTVLGFYTAISTLELRHSVVTSPKIDIELKPGWNSLLIKISTSNKEEWQDMGVCLRISDPPDVAYETKNILWMSPLPGRSTSTPIIVKDHIFVMAEPDELVCIDKVSGKKLWQRQINYYEALTPEEKAKQPRLAQEVDPLVAKLNAMGSGGVFAAKTPPGPFSMKQHEEDKIARIRLRKEIQDKLTEIDSATFSPKYDGHFEAHFGIVGFTMPTPVSDGEKVYVWIGTGIAACFDLDGNKLWMTRVYPGDLTYGSSPALADGVLVTFLNRLYGFDASTGEQLWEQPKVRQNVAALMAAKLSGEQVVVTQRGDVIRPKDGELLFRPRGQGPGDEGWSPPVILGETVFLPRFGVSHVSLLDFTAAASNKWQPKQAGTIQMDESISRENGKWIDRWTAGSPLIWQGLSYQVDIYHNLYVGDVKTGKMLYRQLLPLEGFMHYNSVPVAASPTLVGDAIIVLDNQGTAAVIQPGPEYKLLARNKISTVLDRNLPLPAQETLSYSPPVVVGNRMYIRGEAFLYCVGEK